MPALRACLLAALLLVASHQSSSATQVLHQSPSELGQSAELVVRGRVISQQSYWDASGKRILTDTEVEIEESYKGRATGRVRVVQAGGVVDGVRMTVHGALQWTEGEEVLLFLESSLPSRYRVAGLSQGKFALERDSRGEIMAQAAPLGGAQLVGGQPALAIRPLRSLLAEALPTLFEEEGR